MSWMPSENKKGFIVRWGYLATMTKSMFGGENAKLSIFRTLFQLLDTASCFGSALTAWEYEGGSAP